MNSNEFLKSVVNEFLDFYYESTYLDIDLISYDFGFLAGVVPDYGYAKILIESDLEYLTNTLNYWMMSLIKWDSWCKVLESYQDEDAWRIRYDFSDYIANHCVIQPFAIRDLFTHVCTNAFHQIKITRSEENYPDVLDLDPKTPKQRPPNRRQKEKQLQDLISAWPLSVNFKKTFMELNSKAYQEKTADYRNKINHSIAPRFESGYTKMVKRIVSQSTDPVDVGGGRYEQKYIEGAMSVSYGIGGTPPLSYELTKKLNEEQFFVARHCYDEYIKLMKSTIS